MPNDNMPSDQNTNVNPDGSFRQAVPPPVRIIRDPRILEENRKTRNLLTAIKLENFKGIGAPVRIELKPITLLFGPNSAGKSTILHAFHYAREIFERYNLNADQTLAGGKFVDLGGFQNIVHGRDTSRPIKLSFELDLRGVPLPTYITPGVFGKAVDYQVLGFAQDIETAEVSISVVARKNKLEEITYFVTDYVVEINGLPLAKIWSAPRSGTVLTDINYRHPIFSHWKVMEVLAQLADMEKNGVQPSENLLFNQFSLHDTNDAVPRWGQILSIDELPEEWNGEDIKKEFTEGVASFLKDFTAMLSQLMVGTGETLRNCLQNFRYMGPIRETPTRGYFPPKSPDDSRWASGLAAWDMLSTAPEKYVHQVSDWLSQPDRLNTGYRLERRQFKRLDMGNPVVVSLMAGLSIDHSDVAKLDLKNIPTESQLVIVSEKSNLDLLPHDVGIGISQLLPVVTAAMGGMQRLVMIEQPELHVHPRIQAELGDLFIESALSGANGGHHFMIETHSEHLLLRLLRRIRETSDETKMPDQHPGLSPDDVSVIYVQSTESGSVVRNLRIDHQGEFLDKWPHGFFAERATELFS